MHLTTVQLQQILNLPILNHYLTKGSIIILMLFSQSFKFIQYNLSERHINTFIRQKAEAVPMLLAGHQEGHLDHKYSTPQKGSMRG